MMGEKEIVMQRICRAGMVLGVALTLAGCGNDGLPAGAKADGAVETWDGARADLAEGRRPKEAVYHFNKDIFASITYDPEGNITGVESEDVIVRDWPEAFTRVLDADGAIHGYDYSDLDGEVRKYYYEYSPENYNVQTRKMEYEYIKGTNHSYLFSESGVVLKRSSYEEDGTEENYIYIYDSKGRPIEITREKTEGKESRAWKDTAYTYEKDLLLTSVTSYFSSGGILKTETFEREYDANENMVCLRYYRDMVLRRIREWQYDGDGKLLQHKCTEGHRADSDTVDYYETYDITQYNESGDIMEESRKISINGKEYTVEKTEYMYDAEGRVTEVNTYAVLAGSSDDEKADWCSGGGNTELYITRKVEYQYDSHDTVKGKVTDYQYEANKDYSKVNLTGENESEWIELPAAVPNTNSYDFSDIMILLEYVKPEGYWTITYYTEEEVEQYLHDQEFSPVK